jgi:hypothetical protein
MEVDEVNPSGDLSLFREQTGDQIPRDNKEYIYSNWPSREEGLIGMVQNDKHDCDSPQTFDVRPERNPVTPIGVLFPSN